ncbi:MAG: peptide-methionine (R)-S-oxide reductase MsrB [Verrucomicrobiia bacterium]
MKRSLLILAALAVIAAAVARSPSPTEKPMKKDFVTVRLLDASGGVTQPFETPKVVKSEAAWRAQLTEEQFRITRGHGTERAFCGIFHDNHKKGVYACIGCGLPLFRSDAKFDSGTGWPSFFQPFAKENIGESRDTSYGTVRIEVHCVRCDSHLGHVFPDGPLPTRLRYCINSDALSFHERPAKNPRPEKIILGAGCFWEVEEAFRKLPGVVSTRAGYAGGHTKNPSYEEVHAGKTGHAEVVEVEFDPSRISIGQLLEEFWQKHNPVTLRKTGPDNGEPYRSAILFTSPEQEAAARESAAQFEKEQGNQRISTEISLLGVFYPAEDRHQKYHEKHGLTASPPE